MSITLESKSLKYLTPEHLVCSVQDNGGRVPVRSLIGEAIDLAMHSTVYYKVQFTHCGKVYMIDGRKIVDDIDKAGVDHAHN